MTERSQPEALRLVNNRHNAHTLAWQANACAELRRLTEVNQELLQALRHVEGALLDITCERTSILKGVRAAIAKATGASA